MIECLQNEAERINPHINTRPELLSPTGVMAVFLFHLLEENNETMITDGAAQPIQPAPIVPPVLPITQPIRHIEDRVISALRLTYWDARIIGFWATYGITLMRFALGIVFFWFGVLKFFPGLSTAENLAGKTIFKLTAGHIEPQLSVPLLAAWECLIGIGLISGRLPRATLLLLLGQMMGTVLPLFFFPGETWEHFPYAPTMEGQYIVKNIVIVTAAMVVGSTARGGRLVSDAKAAQMAEKVEAKHNRFRRRFRAEPDGHKRDKL